MPDLGKYAFEVGLAYGVTLVLLAGVTGLVVWRAGRVKRALAEVEARIEKDTSNG